jgi:hypothetical protein
MANRKVRTTQSRKELTPFARRGAARVALHTPRPEAEILVSAVNMYACASGLPALCTMCANTEVRERAQTQGVFCRKNRRKLRHNRG